MTKFFDSVNLFFSIAIPTILIAASFAVGAVAGHYHGVAVTLERFTLISSEAMKGK